MMPAHVQAAEATIAAVDMLVLQLESPLDVVVYARSVQKL